MANLPKKIITDREGNEVLPITHVSAVYDDNGTPVDTLLTNIGEDIENKNYVPTLLSAPTSSTTTYAKGGHTKDFEVGQFCRVANAGGYDFYQLYDLATVSDTTTATWRKVEDTNTTYQLTVNGTPAGDTTSGTSLGSIYTPTSAGMEGQMLIANASGIPAWGSKPSYGYGEIGYETATQTTSGAVTVNGTKPLHIITLSGAATSVAFSSGNLPAVGHSCHIIFKASTATTVSIAHVTTGAVRYICPEGESPSDIDVPAGGYAEIDLLRGSDTTESNATVSWIYVRGV